MQKYKGYIILSMVFLIIITGMSYYFPRYYTPKGEKKVQVLVAIKDLEIGTIIDETMVEPIMTYQSKLPKYTAVNMKDVVGYKVVNPIYANEPISAQRILHRDKWLNEDERYTALNVKVSGLVADDVQVGDYVDVKINYNQSKSPDVVLAKKRVLSKRDSTGNEISKLNKNPVEYIVVVATVQEEGRVRDAEKQGVIYTVKYNDNSQPALPVTYKASWENPSYIPTTTPDTATPTNGTSPDNQGELIPSDSYFKANTNQGANDIKGGTQ